MMSTGSKRRKVTVDIKPQLKFDRGSVFERLGNQAREKQKKWKDTTELKKSKKQAHKLVGEDNEFVKKSKTSLKTDLPGTSKKSRETDGEKYSHRSDTKDQAKPHKHGGGHRAKLSPEPVKSNSKHKIDAEQAHRIRKMDNLIIEKRISPSSSSHERSRSVSAGSIRSRKKAKKHASKHASPEGEFEKERYKSKSPEPHGHKKYKERGRSREPKRKHEKSQQKFSDERDDFSYEQISPERVKQTSHKKKDAKSAKVVKTAKKDTAHSDKKYTKTKHSKNQDWDENTEKTYSRNASSDELLKEDTHHKSAKKESKRHAGRELKRVNASDEEPVKNKRRKCEVSPPLSSPSRPKKHAKVPFEEEVGKKDKLAQDGKKSATSKSSSSKKKHKDEEILPKKKQKDEFLQPMHSDFSSSSKHSQIEYSEQSDYIDERFSDELAVKEKKKKPKLKKKKKEKETDVHTGTDKSTFENDEPIVDKQLKKQAKKRKNKREGRSWSFSESEQERSNVKGGKPEGGRVESKKKKDPYYPPESVKAEPAEKPRRIREHDDIPPPKHSIRDSGSPRHSRRRDISPNRPRKDNTTMENSRREEIFAERPRGSRSREDASVDRLQPDYDHPTKQGRMSDISPKRSHRDVSPRRPHGEERYDERVVMNQPSERLRRDDIATQKHSYRVGLSPRRGDDIGTKQTYRESVVSRRRDDVSPKRIHRDNISPTGLRRERVSPMNQSKLSHVITRKSDVSLKQKEFPREIHEGSKRKRDSYIGLKHSSGDMRFSPERKDDFPRHERRSGHRSMERTRERDWETTQNVRQESGRRRDAPQRLLPERRLDSPRMPGGKFVPQRKMMLEPEIFPPHPPPPETFPQKERWEKKRDRRPLVPTSRHAMQVERDFQRPSLAQSHPKPKRHLVKEKYSDVDRKYFDRKFQDKGWIDPAPRSDSKDRKYLPHDESKDRRMRSGSRDSRSSSQHSREILGKNRQPEVNSRDPSPQNRSSTNIEYKRYNRGKPDTQKERNAGKRNDALTSRESAVSIDRKGKKYVDNARTPTRGRSTERTKLGEAQKLQKLPSKRRHEAIVPAARSSSSSRSSQGRDHSGRKKEGSPRRVVLKSRRKTRDDTQDNPGRKQEHTAGADGERKMPENITDGELTILIKNDDKAAEAAPEPTIMEVDWNELPQAAETEAPTMKEQSSVLKNFTPSHILLQTGIATELLSPDVLKKLNLLCQQNQAPQQNSSPSNDVKNILGGTLHSYNDERLRKRLLGYNTRYRYPLIPPAVINAKTYSSSMKTYMSACKIVV